MRLGCRLGPVLGHCLVVLHHRFADPAQVHGVADQLVLRRHQCLCGAGFAVARGAVLGLVVDVGLFGDLRHPHVHAALGEHGVGYGDVHTTLALPVDHQDLALLTGGVEDLLQLGFRVGAPLGDPVVVDRLDRLPWHSGPQQSADLFFDQIVAVAEDLLEAAVAAVPHLVGVSGHRIQLGPSVLVQVGLALHQLRRVVGIDFVRCVEPVHHLQHATQIVQRARGAGDVVEKAVGAVYLGRGDALRRVRVGAHHNPVLLGVHPLGLGGPDLLGLDGLGQARLARLCAPA